MDHASQLISSFRHFQLVRAALELGLFEWLLEHGPASHSRIADSMRLHHQRLDSFLAHLVQTNWLKFDGNNYTPSMRACQLIGVMTPTGCTARTLLGIGNPQSCWNRMSELLLTLDDEPGADATGEWPPAN